MIRPSRFPIIYFQLPDEFDRDELATLLCWRHMSTPPRKVIYFWSQEGFIEKCDERLHYRKSHGNQHT